MGTEITHQNNKSFRGPGNGPETALYYTVLLRTIEDERNLYTQSSQHLRPLYTAGNKSCRGPGNGPDTTLYYTVLRRTKANTYDRSTPRIASSQKTYDFGEATILFQENVRNGQKSVVPGPPLTGPPSTE